MDSLKKKLCSILTILCVFVFCANDGFCETEKDFKVVGYYSEIFNDSIDENVQFDKVTHIIYAFLIPRKDGSLIDIKKSEKLKELVKKSHQNHVKVLMAIGGWSYENIPLDPTFEKMAASKESRDRFIHEVGNFIEKYHLDGVEIDWEYPDVGISTQNYEKLVLGLREKLKDKYLTAALNGAWSKTEGPEVSKAVTKHCLEAFDWINVMAYDMNNEQHSPFWFANTSIEYWLNRGVPKEKIVLGVPFYARPSWKQYRDLIKEDPSNAYKDYSSGTPLDSYYNGIETIKEKTRLALRKASGVMTFDMNEDTMDDTSLLKSIKDTVYENQSIGMNWDEKIYCILNGRELTFIEDENMGIPFIDKNNRILLPVRKPLEAIGANITFDQNTQCIQATKDILCVTIPINKNFIKVNDKIIKMDTKAFIKNGRTYMPLKYIFEGFNYKIDWHGDSHTVWINQ